MVLSSTWCYDVLLCTIILSSCLLKIYMCCIMLVLSEVVTVRCVINSRAGQVRMICGTYSSIIHNIAGLIACPAREEKAGEENNNKKHGHGPHYQKVIGQNLGHIWPEYAGHLYLPCASQAILILVTRRSRQHLLLCFCIILSFSNQSKHGREGICFLRACSSTLSH